MEKGYKRISEIFGIICILIGAGVLIRTACFVVSCDIWFDELFTVELALKDTGSLLSMASRDVHPPLYYLIVRLVYIMLHTTFGTGIVTAAKITSLIPYVLVIIYLVTFVRRHFGMLASGMTFLMIVTMPHMSEFMAEARMYSWAAFCVFAMFIHAAEYISALARTQYKNIIFIFIYGVAAMYLHYYSFICAGIIAVCVLVYVIVLICRNKKSPEDKVDITKISPLLICIVLALIAYIPWIRALMSQMGQVRSSYWIQPVSLRTIPGCLKYIFKPEFESAVLSYVCAGILIAGYVWMLVTGLVMSRRGGSRGAKENHGSKPRTNIYSVYAFGSLIVCAGLVIAGLILSVIFRPVFVYRYMMPAMFVFWMGFAVLIKNTIDIVFTHKAADNVTSDTTKCGSDTRRSIPYVVPALAATVLVLCALILTGVRSFNLFRWEEMHKSSEVERTLEVFEEIRRDYPDTLIVCNFNQIQALMWYYLDNDSVLWGWTDETLIADICDRSPIVMTTDTDEIKRLVTERGQNSFLFFGSGNAREEIIAEWNSYGIFTELLQDSCFLERYYINIYEIAF